MVAGGHCPASSPPWHQHGLELHTQPESGCREGASIPPPPAWNNSQEDEKCHKLFTHKRDEKGEEGEEERLRGRDT